ncbi:hypothetical protein MMC25_001555 [Agyrium rufum]|nr:hypothetical protein [Agyrium rufum]
MAEIFASASTVKQVDSHTYTGFFPKDWAIGSVPHGGFVTSCIQSASTLHFATTHSSLHQPHQQNIHLSFVRRTSVAPFTIRITDTKLGSRTSNIHITLLQHDEPSESNPTPEERIEVVGYIIHTNLHTETGISLDTQWTLSPPPAPFPTDFSLLKADQDANWTFLPDPLPVSRSRRALARVQFGLPRHGQPQISIVDEWLRFRSGERFTDTSLGYVCDLFLQVVEMYRAEKDGSVGVADGARGGEGPPGGKSAWPLFWYPTLVLNIDVKKALPEEGVEWLFVRVRAKQIRNGRLDLEVVVMDEGGELVALSHHAVLVMDMGRNTQVRQGKDRSKI